MANVINAAFLAKAISVESVAKISDFVVFKQPPQVIKQNPAAGTPVIAGMTIEISAVSLSDVPFRVIDDNKVLAVKDVAVADLKHLFENDPRLLAAVKSGTIPDNELAAVTRAINTGLVGKGISGNGVSPTDAASLVKSIGAAGFVDF
ncbi:MAG: hypothetical protein ABI625_04955 [bacterium]